jgi:hypothetical protein
VDKGLFVTLLYQLAFHELKLNAVLRFLRGDLNVIQNQRGRAVGLHAGANDGHTGHELILRTGELAFNTDQRTLNLFDGAKGSAEPAHSSRQSFAFLIETCVQLLLLAMVSIGVGAGSTGSLGRPDQPASG